jgi:hypothetical protein
MEQIVETTRAGYRTGTMDFSALTDAERVLLDLKLETANERTAHAIALADLSLIVAGTPPPNAPFLSGSSGREPAPFQIESQSRTPAATKN